MSTPLEEGRSTAAAAEPPSFVVDAFPEPRAAVAAPAPPARPIAHLGRGFGLVLTSPGVLLFLLFAALVLAVPAALPVIESAGLELGHGPWAGPAASYDFLYSAPHWVLQEWQRHDRNTPLIAQKALGLTFFLSSLFGLLVCGGWMSLATGGRPRGRLGAFLRGGGTWFWPFLRTWVLGMALAFGCAWLVWEQPGQWVFRELLPDGSLERADSESTARLLRYGREVAYLLLVFLGELLLDLGRASMVACNRRSALAAVFRGLGFLLMHPAGSGAVVAGGFAVELAWVGAWTVLTPALGLPFELFVLAVLAGRIACRGARYAALASYTQAVVGRR